MSETRIILRVPQDSDGSLALRAARSLIQSDHKDCVYSYTDGTVIWAYRTKRAVVACDQAVYRP